MSPVMLITSGQPYKSKNKYLEFLCAGRLRVSNNIPVCQSQSFTGKSDAAPGVLSNRFSQSTDRRTTAS